MAGVLRAAWRNLLAGFWLVPGMVAVIITGSAFVLIELDRLAGGRSARVGFDGDAAAAQDILATIAGSLITVAGLTFSLTIVVLTLVSNQFTPRAIRGFLSDRMNQVVAGGFIGIFLYCLLVLRSVRSDGENEFVPALSVTVAIIFGALAVVLLLLFVHHISQSIQASNITARLAHQTLAAVDRVHEHQYGTAPNDQDLNEMVSSFLTRGGDPGTVTPSRPGFVLLVDANSVLKAAPAGSQLHVVVRPGDFVTGDDSLVKIWPPAAVEETRSALRRAIPVANERDLGQDVLFGLRQLADVAVRALSPGINDPTTAVTCIGYLRAVLQRLAGRAYPTVVLRRRDAVIVVENRSFEEYADAAFSEIGRYAGGDARVVVALLEAIRSIGRAVRSADAAERLSILTEIGEAIAAVGLERARAPRDEQLVNQGLRRLRAELGQSSAVIQGHQ